MWDAEGKACPLAEAWPKGRTVGVPVPLTSFSSVDVCTPAAHTHVSGSHVVTERVHSGRLGSRRGRVWVLPGKRGACREAWLRCCRHRRLLPRSRRRRGEAKAGQPSATRRRGGQGAPAGHASLLRAKLGGRLRDADRVQGLQVVLSVFTVHAGISKVVFQF